MAYVAIIHCSLHPESFYGYKLLKVDLYYNPSKSANITKQSYWESNGPTGEIYWKLTKEISLTNPIPDTAKAYKIRLSVNNDFE